jgi:hypothetical protein
VMENHLQYRLLQVGTVHQPGPVFGDMQLESKPSVESVRTLHTGYFQRLMRASEWVCEFTPSQPQAAVQRKNKL